MKQAKANSLQDVAMHLGLSAATVSRALRHDPAIPQNTRDRVRAAVERLGYRASPMVSALMTQVRRRGTTTMANLSCLYEKHPAPNLLQAQQEVMQGFTEAARRLGYGVDLELWPLTTGSTASLARQWRTRRVGGVFLYNVRSETTLEFPWHELAWVIGGHISGAPELHRVGNEIYQLVRTAVRQALHLGYRRPALAVPTRGARREGLRWAGAFLANSMHCQPEVEMPRIFRGEWNRHAFVTWLREAKPDVVLGLTDEALEWTASSRLRKHELPAFIHLAANTSAYPITGVKQDFFAMGRAAAQVLDSLLRRNELGVPEHPTTLTVAGRWWDGRSIALQQADGV